jgi:hypothetical protein
MALFRGLFLGVARPGLLLQSWMLILLRSWAVALWPFMRLTAVAVPTAVVG